MEELTGHVFRIVLQPSYFHRGFFNMSVATDRLIRRDRGPMAVLLWTGTREIGTIVTRTANLTQAPRIYPRAALRDWFQHNFRIGDVLRYEILAPDRIRVLGL